MNTDHNVSINGAVAIKGKNGVELNLIPWEAKAVTIASKTIWPKPGLVFVGVSGDVAIIPYGNPDTDLADPTTWVVFKGVPAGTFLPVYVRRIGDVGAGTSATDLVICF